MNNNVEISGTWEEYLNYTKYCQSIIEYHQRINDSKPKKFQISYDDICEEHLPSFKNWKKMIDV